MNNSGANHKGASQNTQHNPSNIRNATQKHQYSEHEEKLTNDANYDPDTQKPTVDMDFEDKSENVSKDEK